MSEFCVGQFDKTDSQAVTDAAADYAVAGPTNANRTLIVQSDRVVHIDILGDATIANSLRIPADTPCRVMCFGGTNISSILGTGESDGTIWFTVVP